MKKLTAERARERIEHLKAWQAQRGLTLREEEYLEGLERMLVAEARVAELERRKAIDFYLVAGVLATYDLDHLPITKRAELIKQVFEANDYV